MKKELIIIMVGMFILILSNISAGNISLKLEPSRLNLTGFTGEKICQELTIEYNIEDGTIEGRDLWAPEGVTEKVLSLHNLEAGVLGLTFEYPKSITVDNSKVVDVCITASKKGLYHGALLYRTIQSGNVGIELNVWVTADIKENTAVKTSTKRSSSSSSSSHSSNSDSEVISDVPLVQKTEESKENLEVISLTGKSSNVKENPKSKGLLIGIGATFLIAIILISVLAISKGGKKKRDK